MMLQIFSIRDLKGDVFMTPFFHHNIGMAVRHFSDEVNREDPSNLLSRHPEDFELYHLGAFGDGDAVFNLLAKPKQLLLGSEAVKVR